MWTCQLHSDTGSELVDVWISARRAAEHPEILGNAEGHCVPCAASPMHWDASATFYMCRGCPEQSGLGWFKTSFWPKGLVKVVQAVQDWESPRGPVHRHWKSG